MQLTSIKYTQHEGKPAEWRINSEFDAVNLIVGKNASGKTRTLNIIQNFAKQIARHKRVVFNSGDYELHFENKNTKYKYFLKYEDKEVLEEKLFIGRKIYLKRGASGVGEIETEQVKKKLKFQLDKDQIALAVKRDPFQHPFLEDLSEWADKLVHFSFGSSLGKDEVTVFVKEDKKKKKIDTKETNRVVSIFKDGFDKFGDQFIEAIKNDMAEVGYTLESISIDQPINLRIETNLQSVPASILVKEKGLPFEIDQFDMSQGMYRALSLLIQINYLSFHDLFGIVLIDDIGEGLDYERSTLLVNLLISKSTKSEFQLIMTTNDRFVMNNVPLEFWSIIYRAETDVKFFNSRSDKKLFQRFELTGLSNFDMFSSNYFLKKLK